MTTTNRAEELTSDCIPDSAFRHSRNPYSHLAPGTHLCRHGRRTHSDRLNSRFPGNGHAAPSRAPFAHDRQCRWLLTLSMLRIPPSVLALRPPGKGPAFIRFLPIAGARVATPVRPTPPCPASALWGQSARRIALGQEQLPARSTRLGHGAADANRTCALADS